ncbi:MAG: hypothetical protein AAGA46_06995 [Cyanobacteria bacterium P01_F01_bin.13]
MGLEGVLIRKVLISTMYYAFVVALLEVLLSILPK